MNRFIAPSASSYTAQAGDSETVISSANATGAAQGWAGTSLTVVLPSPAAVGVGWEIEGVTDANKAVVFDAPLLAAPSAPTLSTANGGSLGARTEYFKATFVNSVGETVASAETSIAIGANQLAVMTSPGAVGNAVAYNVYGASASGAETKQNAAPIALGTAWTEPLGGLVSGSSAPSTGSAPSAYLLDGGQVLGTFVVGPGNYQSTHVWSDGTNFRLLSASAESRRINGTTFEAPSRFVYPGGPGHSATVGDNGSIISSAMTSGGLTVTLPEISAIPAGWTIDLAADAGQPLTVEVNGTDGGSITLGANSVASYELPAATGCMVTLIFDGAVFRLPQAQTIAIGLEPPPGALNFDITGNGQLGIRFTAYSNDLNVGKPYLQLQRALGTHDSPLAVTAGAENGPLDWWFYDGLSPGHNGSGFYPGARVEAVAQENFGAQHHGTALHFVAQHVGDVDAAGTATVASGVMTILPNPQGTWAVGQTVDGLPGSPTIVSAGTGTGGAGTYNLSDGSLTVASPIAVAGIPAATNALAHQDFYLLNGQFTAAFNSTSSFAPPFTSELDTTTGFNFPQPGYVGMSVSAWQFFRGHSLGGEDTLVELFLGGDNVLTMGPDGGYTEISFALNMGIIGGANGDLGLKLMAPSAGFVESVIGATLIDVVSSVARYPGTDDAVSLGQSGNRWSTVYTMGVSLPGGTNPVFSTLGSITTGAGSDTATLTNAPAPGNPTKWIPINDDGVTRYLPAW